MEFFAQLLEPIDISLGGLRIHGHEERQAGSVLRLDAFFPHVARVTLATEVVWIKALGKEAPAPFDMGLAFVELSPSTQDTLRMLLGAAEHEGPGESMVEPAQARVQSSVRLARNEPQSTSKEAFALGVEIDNALARWDDGAALQSAPSLESGRDLSTPSIERAAAGIIEDSDAPVISHYEIDPSRYVLDRYLAGDYTGALDIADVVLTETPGNLLVRECGDRSRNALAKIYAEKLGPLDRVPVVITDNAKTQCASIDHRAGFLLSLIDGTSSLEAIHDACGMPRLDALRIVQEMVQRRIVGFK